MHFANIAKKARTTPARPDWPRLQAWTFGGLGGGGNLAVQEGGLAGGQVCRALGLKALGKVARPLASGKKRGKRGSRREHLNFSGDDKGQKANESCRGQKEKAEASEGGEGGVQACGACGGNGAFSGGAAASISARQARRPKVAGSLGGQDDKLREGAVEDFKGAQASSRCSLKKRRGGKVCGQRGSAGARA